MTDTPTATAPAPTEISSLDLDRLSISLSSIAQALVQDHLRWNEGFYNWTRMQLMNMQQIPMEADADFLNHQNAIIALLRRFEDAGEILEKSGQPQLKEAITGYLTGIRQLIETAQSALGAMKADDIKTQQAIAGIQNKIFETNVAAGQESYRIQSEAGNAMIEAGAKTIADRQASFQKINDSIAAALRGSSY